MIANASAARAYFGAVPPVHLERRFFLDVLFTLGDGEVLSGGIICLPVCTLYEIVESSPLSSSIIFGWEVGEDLVVCAWRWIFCYCPGFGS